ncbi:MAG: class I SAM-dependent methyltransferase [Ignavibacteria bacterium]|nr:class I SAM-dependent methyltransferase [Ignavibacteria bacterium]
MNLRKIYYLLSPDTRRLLRRIVYFPLDFYNSLLQKKNIISPPIGKIYVGAGDFERQGLLFFEYFTTYGNLKPTHHVLDIGCGIGRMAIPLTSYITPPGSYHGFDIVKDGIDWCTDNISKHFPHFHFLHIDLHNDLYTSKGSSAQNFVFPYLDDQFDFIFLTSVFTHLVPAEMEQYMREISRVLNHGGRCLATFFLFDDTFRNSTIKEFSFPYNYGHYRLMDDKVQSANVAYEREYVESIITQNGLILDKFIEGSWGGKAPQHVVSYQDMMIISKL